MEGELELHTYIGNDIKWLDLMDNDDFKSFEEEHGKFLNSDKIGDIVIVNIIIISRMKKLNIK